MLRFFRHIRKSLLGKNRFSKYLLYAVGEILLVVIGILVALQVDNWNETNQNKEKVFRLLRKIQRDIEADVASIHEAIPYYAEKDSIGNLVLNDLLTPEDYKDPNNRKLHDMVFDLLPMNMKRVGYDNLRASQFMIPKEFDSVVEQLIYQYEEVLKIFEKTHDFLLEDVRKNEDFMFLNYDWFSDPRSYHFNEDRIDFFVNNVRYKGMVRNYHEASTEEYVDWATRYLEVATNNYEAIYSMLGENPGPGSIYDTTALEKRYLGDYRLMTGDTVAFFISNGRIYARGARLNVLFPYGRNKFFSRNNYARFDAAGDSLYLYIMAYKSGREPAGVRINRSKN